MILNFISAINLLKKMTMLFKIVCNILNKLLNYLFPPNTIFHLTPEIENFSNSLEQKLHNEKFS